MSTGSPRLRVLPIPQSAPPIIAVDEVTMPRNPYVQDALAVDFTPDDDRYFDQQRTRTLDLPAPQAFTQQLAQALVEVITGSRPAPQVVRWTTPEVYAVLARRSLVAAAATCPRRGARSCVGCGSRCRPTASSRPVRSSFTTSGSGPWRCG